MLSPLYKVCSIVCQCYISAARKAAEEFSFLCCFLGFCAFMIWWRPSLKFLALCCNDESINWLALSYFDNQVSEILWFQLLVYFLLYENKLNIFGLRTEQYIWWCYFGLCEKNWKTALTISGVYRPKNWNKSTVKTTVLHVACSKGAETLGNCWCGPLKQSVWRYMHSWNGTKGYNCTNTLHLPRNNSQSADIFTSLNLDVSDVSESLCSTSEAFQRLLLCWL